MKKLLVLLFALLCCPFIDSNASTRQTYNFAVTKIPFTIIDAEVDGVRCPARKIICTIDFETKSIASSFAQDVVEYDIYTMDTSELLYSSVNDADFIEYLEILDGEFIIEFNTAHYKYVGVFSLNDFE